MVKFKILNIDESKKYVAKKDSYLDYITPFYIKKILKKSNSNYDDFIKNFQNSCVNPNINSYSFFEIFEKRINLSLINLKISIDETIYIIFTDGSDNIHLPYTKGKSIILPFDITNSSYYSLIVHELWHILSRNNKKLRLDAYKSIGWIYHENLFNNNILHQEFINPDACHHDHYINLNDINGNNFNISPIMIESCFNNYFAVFDENLNFLRLDNYKNFKSYKELWKNTGYNNHPEEICAEHFMLLVLDKKVPDKFILEKFYNSLLLNIGL